MRLNGHVAYLLASVGWLTQKVYTTFGETSTLVWVVRRSNPRIASTVTPMLCGRLETNGANRGYFLELRSAGRLRPVGGVRSATPMALTPEEERDLHEQLARLLQEHRDLDSAIEALQDAPGSDLLQVQRLKKRKLYLRDRISFIEDQLTPDIIA
jgi:hypothetical protein